MTTTVPGVKPPMLNNQIYDGVKWTAQIALPAAGTLYFALSVIWGFPYAEQVVGSITAVDLFLGALLGLSNRRYIRSGAKYDGELLVDTSNPGKIVYALNMDQPLDELDQNESITLKIDNPPRLTDSQ